MTREIRDWSGSAFDAIPASRPQAERSDLGCALAPAAAEPSSERLIPCANCDCGLAEGRQGSAFAAALVVLSIPLGIAAWVGIFSLLLRLF